MSDKQVTKSARLSSRARVASRRGTVVVHRAGPTPEQAWLNAWDAGKIRWSDIPAKFRR